MTGSLILPFSAMSGVDFVLYVVFQSVDSKFCSKEVNLFTSFGQQFFETDLHLCFVLLQDLECLQQSSSKFKVEFVKVCLCTVQCSIWTGSDCKRIKYIHFHQNFDLHKFVRFLAQLQWVSQMNVDNALIPCLLLEAVTVVLWQGPHSGCHVV